MAKASKQTKKFQNKHLKHTIEHRKKVQDFNKKAALRKKGKGEAPIRKDGKSKEVFDDMSVDEFFESGFEVPKEKKKKKVAEEEEDSSSEEEDMEMNLENLEEEDPEFYKYLKENDNDLLEGVNPLDAISDEEEEEEEEEVAEPDAPQDPHDKIEITTKLVKKWDTQLQKPTPKIIRNIIIAFKAAVNINKGEDYKYSVVDPKAFTELMLLVLKKIPIAIQNLIKYKVKNNVRTVPQNPQATQIGSILKSHASSYITLLEDINNTETAALILASIHEVMPYYISHRRLLKQIISAITNVWASSNIIDIQIASFAFINNIVREYPKSLLETVLKQSYQSFLQHCRKTNIHTMDRINFCKNSLAELFGIDSTIGYQTGFEYVRQLAIHLRNSINGKGAAAIYNWQYCHSLDFWSRVLALNEGLNQLIYPLVQVTIGTIRLIPTAQFFPLRFYLIRSLLRLKTVYIPIFPLLFEILSSTAITKSPKPSNNNLQFVDFEHNIKVNQAYLGTKIFQDGICEQFIELTFEFFGVYAKNIAFPELVTPAVLSLKRFTKKSKNAKFNKQLNQLIEKLNANAQFINSKRSNVEYGPSNKQEVSNFLKEFEWEKTPLGQYIIVQRQLKEERIKLLKQAQEDAKEKEGKDQED
ncbi:NOC2 [Candida pseudojiufengensis]|uniref:NOC2 n=1 Tax=Candida pseudojiufengensis TaxID=497109 RepID=UPI0022255B0A|nr:NOC2 [Candida pseudojiufengensis]KAI5962492.1 NOC2 [Candida pseudojiufengensis]